MPALSDPPPNGALEALLRKVVGSNDAQTASAPTVHRNINGHVNGDSTAALAAASQYLADGLHHAKTTLDGHADGRGGSSHSEEEIAHALNRLLISGVIAPLIHSPSSQDHVPAQQPSAGVE
ncbi:hypothetical protein, partial [Sporisorium scitamineum]